MKDNKMNGEKKIKELIIARNTLHRLENIGILENNLSMEQITAIRIAEFALDELSNAAVAHKLDSRKKSIKYSCSECKGVFYMYDKYDYCPRCGAHIVGVEG